MKGRRCARERGAMRERDHKGDRASNLSNTTMVIWLLIVVITSGECHIVIPWSSLVWMEVVWVLKKSKLMKDALGCILFGKI